MLGYLLRRLFLFVPTLFVVSLLTFWLSEQTPGEPLTDRAEAEGIFFPPGTSMDKRNTVYRDLARRYELDIPLFYFSLESAAYPDTLHRILQRDRRAARADMIARTGNWPLAERYFSAITQKLRTEPPTEQRKTLERLERTARPERIAALLRNHPDFTEIQTAYDELIATPTPGKLYLPGFAWHGFRNRYHRWITGFLRGDFGTSYEDGRPVANRIADALRWTLILSLGAIALSYFLSILLGVFMARRRDFPTDRRLTIFLFVLYSLPTFWIGSMLLIFFTNPTYGMNWFPGIGLGELPGDAPFWSRFRETAGHLVLPVLCLTYPTLAFLSRQVRASTGRELDRLYVQAARAHGLPERRVVWRHAFRNALFPLITVLSRVFPAAVAGSVIIELVFNIPGMGRLTISSIYLQDYPTLFAIVLLGAFLTVFGMLLSDLLYALADPRVRFQKSLS